MKRTTVGIITLVFLAATCYFVAHALGVVSARNMSAGQEEVLKKELPKKVTLSKDSQSDKYGEVAFDHDTHTFKNYSVDGKAPIGCADCHHTDQPASALKPPLKTSERKIVLTVEALKAPDAVGVRTCRACHLQVGDDSKEMPSVTYEGKSSPSKLTNELAYHLNCNTCHDAAIKARPELKGKIPGTNDCGKCHVPLE
jgi:cytochrome c7-like protein